MKHLSFKILTLICFMQRQCLVGSLSGALASKKVSEAFIRSAKYGWKSYV